MNWVIGQTFVGNKNGVKYRVDSVTEQFINLKNANTYEDVVIPVDLADNLDITTLSSHSLPCSDKKDFISIVEIGKYMQVDPQLWASFCFSNGIIGISPIREKYISGELLPIISNYRFLFDHALLCLCSDSSIILVCNPYLTRKEIDAICSRLNLECVILGKDRSFYAPGRSNLVVFDLGSGV